MCTSTARRAVPSRIGNAVCCGTREPPTEPRDDWRLPSVAVVLPNPTTAGVTGFAYRAEGQRQPAASLLSRLSDQGAATRFGTR
jgi:hypothetical protein